MSTFVYLVRHAAHIDLGQRLSGRLDSVPLSDDGKRQAEQLSQRLASVRLDAVHSSPIERARVTAGGIARRAGVETIIEPALGEIDFGVWTGRRFDELDGDPAWTRWNVARGTACPPDGEAMAAAQARAVAHVDAAARAYAGGTLAMVSHADIIRGIIAHYLGLPLDNLLRFDVDPASISLLHVAPWGARLVSLNEKVAA